MGELKPCPFCGCLPNTAAAFVPANGVHHLIMDGWDRISCPVCCFIGPMCRSEGEAITAWNRRAPDAERDALIHDIERHVAIASEEATRAEDALADSARLRERVAGLEAALRDAVPVMRKTAAEYLDSVMVRSDPTTIAPLEWEEITPDLSAIAAAEACIGRVTEPSWLDRIVDTFKPRAAPSTGEGK